MYLTLPTDLSIRQDIINAVKHKLSGASDLGLNSWNVDDYDRTYDYDNADQNVRAVGVFAHSNGYLKTGEDAVRISFVQFSGVSIKLLYWLEKLAEMFYRFSMLRTTLGSHCQCSLISILTFLSSPFTMS